MPQKEESKIQENTQ
jgi:pimeloyl-ACP methyl ester carboxylesterase